MKRYITRRLLLLLPTLLLVSFLVFCIVRIIPGDAVTLMVAEMGFADDEAELRAVLGLDQSLPRQYWNYMRNALRGDLGTSLWSGQPVLEEITRRLPLTFRLALMALFWTLLTGIPLGVLSALKQDTWLDYLLRSVSVGGLSIPSFWLATLLVVFGAIWFRWVPPIDFIPFGEDPLASLGQLVVPSLVLSVALSASIMRMTRTMMLEVMREDYIRTARAKGLSEWVVVIRHALANSLIPVLSIMGIQMAFLVGGTVIMESIFVLPGMGKYLLDAITWRDYPVIQGINLFICTLIICINLVIDLLYGVLDPRIRY
ncbi:ABC transporter permease [Desulfatitalea alkaliphila]|uniref:ABC transporter permease n=1 Tax=Desulfatitalea alkaliphila TaxID=2929485 RepID=A0AA41R3S1_9BACT|nr:ABC transporter permease [Desulfatitalea alkaliphila]MCJ8500246.1 ABC transporter permease [Desulfatitalea alkaliphila]